MRFRRWLLPLAIFSGCSSDLDNPFTDDFIRVNLKKDNVIKEPFIRPDDKDRPFFYDSDYTKEHKPFYFFNLEETHSKIILDTEFLKINFSVREGIWKRRHITIDGYEGIELIHESKNSLGRNFICIDLEREYQSLSFGPYFSFRGGGIRSPSIGVYINFFVYDQSEYRTHTPREKLIELLSK